MTLDDLTRQRSPQTFRGILAYLAVRNAAIMVAALLAAAITYAR